ncbi:MAG: protein kinase [Nannocystaceae bacterium]
MQALTPTDAGAPPASASPGTPAGARAGRYVLGPALGRGAGGIVRRAHDPELGRDVAVKLVMVAAPGGALTSTDGARSQFVPSVTTRRDDSLVGDELVAPDTQLLAEARALASVAHPNIVEVFDVGPIEGGVFIAMALVAGQSLRARLQSQALAWREAVALLLPTASALAAAHAVGIVHGDFKPDNVLVGDDGRPRVVDFGLARAIGDGPTATDPGRVVADDAHSGGALFGSPAYLAPECWSSRSRRASADQYAFFVTLYEAIAGVRPFGSARTLTQLYQTMCEGPDLRLLRGRAPKPLVDVIARGLDPQPERRFGSMTEVGEALRRLLHGLRRRRVFAGAAIAALSLAALATSVVVVEALQRRRAVERLREDCRTQAAGFAEVWAPEHGPALAAVMAEVDPVLGADTADRVRALLDDHAQAWAQLRLQTCERAAVAATPAPLDDARAACFDDDRMQASALVEVLHDPDVGVVRRAVLAAADLPPVARCDDEASLLRRRPRPDDAALLATIRARERDLLVVEELAAAGRVDEARRRLASAQQAAPTWPPLLARIALTQAKIDIEDGAYQRVLTPLERAFHQAREAADDALAVPIATELAAVLGQKLARFDDAMAWVRHAEAVLQGERADDGEARAQLELVTANVLGRRGELPHALELANSAAQLAARSSGPSTRRWRGPSSRSAACRAAPAPTPSRSPPTSTRSRSSSARWDPITPSSPRCSTTSGSRASSCGGSTTRAATTCARWHCASARSTRPPRSRHRTVGPGLRRARGCNFDEAQARFTRALQIREAAFGPEHPAVADTLANLAQVAKARGECETATGALRRALAIVEASAPEDHATRARHLVNLGDARRSCSDRAGAREAYLQAQTLAGAAAPAALRARIDAGLTATADAP